MKGEMDQGRYWLKEKEELWTYSGLSFMKRAHYQVLMEFGLDRDVQLPFIGTPHTTCANQVEGFRQARTLGS